MITISKIIETTIICQKIHQGFIFPKDMPYIKILSAIKYWFYLPAYIIFNNKNVKKVSWPRPVRIW